MRFVNKQFLNDASEETGYIIVKCASDRCSDLGLHSAENPYMEAEVQIGDCSKKIYLDFSCTKDSDVGKRLAKIDVLIDNLTELKKSIPITWEDTKLQAATWLEEHKDDDK